MTQRCRASAVLFLTLLGCATGAQEDQGPVTRRISTAHGEIRLGERWDASGVQGVQSGEPTVSLPPGSYPEAQSTWITRDSDLTVVEIGLNYRQDLDFASKLRSLVAQMGPPARHERPIHPDSIERAVWTDSLTRFELIKHPTRSVATLYARMTDLRHMEGMRLRAE